MTATIACTVAARLVSGAAMEASAWQSDSPTRLARRAPVSLAPSPQKATVLQDVRGPNYSVASPARVREFVEWQGPARQTEVRSSFRGRFEKGLGITGNAATSLCRVPPAAPAQPRECRSPVVPPAALLPGSQQLHQQGLVPGSHARIHRTPAARV
jgi:hypothetical protein